MKFKVTQKAENCSGEICEIMFYGRTSTPLTPIAMSGQICPESWFFEKFLYFCCR